MSNANPRAISRRRVVKSGLALAGAQIAGPFVLSARAAQAVKIGLDNPLTGPYAALGKNELTGCQMALDEINAKGGILGRPVELVVEDSTSGDAGVAVLKARKLIDGDGGRLSAWQRELRAFARHGSSVERKEHSPHRAWRPYRRGHRLEL